jgi:hypothetical protein
LIDQASAFSGGLPQWRRNRCGYRLTAMLRFTPGTIIRFLDATLVAGIASTRLLHRRADY